jgi:hypothetical protein
MLMLAKGESSCGELAGRADLEDKGALKEDVDARLVVVEEGAELMTLDKWC